MRPVVWSLVVLAACNTGTGDDYYVEPGGGGGSFGNTTGAFPDAAPRDGGGTISARVCGLSEILVWDECAATGLDGVMVMVGAASATARADGSFDIANPSGSNLVWRVNGNAQLASLREYPGELVIPSMPLADYQNLAADTNVLVNPQAGTIFAQVIHMGTPVASATASLSGLVDLVHYDDATAPGDFGVDMTHDAGVIWFPNVPVGTAVTFTVTPPAAVGQPVETIVIVEAETATFATVVIP